MIMSSNIANIIIYLIKVDPPVNFIIRWVDPGVLLIYKIIYFSINKIIYKITIL